MKVTFTKEARSWVTIEDAPIVKRIIAEFSKDPTPVREYAEMAARIAGKSNGVRVIECAAEIAGNSRVWNYYGDDTKMFDVWVTFTAMADNCKFIMGGAYLSDIFQIGSEENNSRIRQWMYVREFVEVRP